MHIFISYSSKNRALVEQLADDLQSLGHHIWFDRELTGGQSWWDTILEQIRGCDLFVFALTPQARESYPCELEYTYAAALNKTVLPVLLQDLNTNHLPSQLAVIQFVDYRQRDVNAVIRLSRALNLLPPAKPLPDSLPPEPEAPISFYSRYSSRVSAPQISEAEQQQLLSKLRAGLADESSAADARALLERLLKRDDLAAAVEKDIRLLLGVPDNTGLPTVQSRPLSVLSPTLARVIDVDSPILSMTFSPDGRYLLLGRFDSQAELLEVESGKTVRLFTGHHHKVANAIFSPDGQFVLTYCDEPSEHHAVRLWDVATGKLLQKFETHTSFVTSIAFAPDSRSIVVGGVDTGLVCTMKQLDLQTGERLREFAGHKDYVKSIVFSPDCRYVLSGSHDKTVRLWDAGTGQVVRIFTDHVNMVKLLLPFVPFGGASVMTSHRNAVESVAFSPDGQTVISGGGSITGDTGGDNSVRLWDIQTGQKIRQLDGHTNTVTQVAFSPDGRYILSASFDCTARLWQVETGGLLRRFDGRTYVHNAVFSPDGNMIATDGEAKKIFLWNITDITTHD